MGKDVYANSMEISCRAADAKVTAAFPDVCLSPPSPPAGPLPVPYPNTSFSRDMKKGSKRVFIGGGPVMLKDQSYYQTSPLGDEAATRSFGAGIISHQITGKTYFVSWSFDVKFENQNVPRHLDLATSNHASLPGNESVPMPSTSKYKPVQQDAAVEGKQTCECCGGKAHTQAQAKGEYMTEDQFYDTANNPGNAAVLAKVRANPKCKHLLPRAGKKAMGCNKYYKTINRKNPPLNEKARIETDWELNAPAYRRFKGVAPGDDVAHRVPKAAGGCPSGQGNLAPRGIKCKKLEDELSDVQNDCAKRVRGT
jgi:hypothetical protein